LCSLYHAKILSVVSYFARLNISFCRRCLSKHVFFLAMILMLTRNRQELGTGPVITYRSYKLGNIYWETFPLRWRTTAVQKHRWACARTVCRSGCHEALGHWLHWLTIVLQCYITVGWVIWPVKSSPEWLVTCRVGR